MRNLIRLLVATALMACASQQPRIYSFDDMEVYPASFDEVWRIVESMSKKEKWRIEETERSWDRAYLTTDWMPDREQGGDYGSVGISLGQGNRPHNDRTREVAISVRVVAESERSTRVKVTCLFRIQTSQGQSGTGQTMFGTSKGIVERQILNTIRSRLASSS